MKEDVIEIKLTREEVHVLVLALVLARQTYFGGRWHIPLSKNNVAVLERFEQLEKKLLEILSFPVTSLPKNHVSRSTEE